MPFSKLFIILASAGCIPILAAAALGLAFPVFVIYNILLLVLWLVDLWMTPGRHVFDVERKCDGKLSIAAENWIEFHVRNTSRFSLGVEMKDEVPDFMDVKERTVKIASHPHETVQGRYAVVPRKRGEYIFAGIHLRYDGVLKLCTRQFRIPLSTICKVYPNIKDLRRYGLEAIQKSRLDPGLKRIWYGGSGTEFESIREYVEGDDFRRINWMATARSAKMMVNTYEPERNQHVFIMVDCGRMMNSELDRIKKLDYAVNAAFLLADAVLRKGDNAGLIAYDSEVRRYVDTGKGPGQFQLLAENLYDVEQHLVTSDIHAALQQLAARHKRRSLLCIFTELSSREEAGRMIQSIHGLARRHVPLIICIRDPRWSILAHDSVQDEKDMFVKAAATQFAAERESIAELFSRNGIAYMDIAPDKLPLEVINRYIQMKETLRL